MAVNNADPSSDSNTPDREIVTTRVFDAPRGLVFKMSDLEHVAKWWGPKGFSNTIYEMDVRPGGVWRFVMHGPDGKDYLNKIIYVEDLTRAIARSSTAAGSATPRTRTK